MRSPKTAIQARYRLTKKIKKFNGFLYRCICQANHLHKCPHKLLNVLYIVKEQLPISQGRPAILRINEGMSTLKSNYFTTFFLWT
jgi:hypothetical protein